MAEEGKQLLIRVRAPGQEIQKDLQKVNTIVISETKQTARQQITILRDTERQQIDAYKRRAIAEQEVLRATLKSEKDRQRAILETERVATESLRRQVMAERAARQPGSGSGFGIARTFAGFAPSVAAGLGATAGYGAAATLLVGIGRRAIEARADYEQLERGLESVTGSAAKTQEQLARLREIAKLPGLGFDEAVKGATRLQAAGLSAEQAEKALRGFGKAIAAVGGTRQDLELVNLALSQIASKGKVSAEEIRQLAERLPQIRQIMKDAFGTADTMAIQKAGIDSPTFLKVLIDAADKTTEVKDTLKNNLVNIEDGFKQLFAEIGRAGQPVVDSVIKPLADFVSNSATGVRNFNNNNANAAARGSLLSDIIEGRGSQNPLSATEKRAIVSKRLGQLSQDIPPGFNPDKSNNSTLIQFARERDALQSFQRGLGMQEQYGKLGTFSMKPKPQIDVTKIAAMQVELEGIPHTISRATTAGAVNTLLNRASTLVSALRTAGSKNDNSGILQRIQEAATDKRNQLATTSKRSTTATADDKAAADRIRISTQRENAERLYSSGVESMSMATTPEEIQKARYTMVTAMQSIQKLQVDEAGAVLKQSKIKDGKNTRAAEATFTSSRESATADYEQRRKDIKKSQVEAEQRILKLTDAQAEEQRKEGEDRMHQYVAFLRAHEEELQMQREKNVSIEEDKNLVDSIIDTRKRIAAAELQMDIKGTYKSVPLDAITRYNNRQTEISKFQNEESGTITPRMPFSERNGADITDAVTIKDKFGGETTMSRQDAEKSGLLKSSAGRDDGKAIEDAITRGFMSLFQMVGQGQGGQKAVAQQALGGLVNDAQQEAAKIGQREFSKALEYGKNRLKPVFDDISKSLKENVRGLNLSAQSIVAAAYGLSGLIKGQGGKGGTGQPDVLDYGIAAASLFPATAPYAVGLKLARQIFKFADGGRPPLGRASIVGERGPELFVPDQPGTIISHEQSKSVMGGGGGITMVVHGGINNGADAELISRQLEMKRKRERLVR